MLRLALALVFAALVAACDKCGDFVPPIRLQVDQMQVCKDEVPRPY
jgi:hypothetical protein